MVPELVVTEIESMHPNIHVEFNHDLFNIKLTWEVRGMMDVLYVYCFKSVGSYKHKLSRIEFLVILYWGINCWRGYFYIYFGAELSCTQDEFLHYETL